MTGRGRRIDLAVGILLGLVLGLVIAYLLVVVIGGGRDASNLSTPTTAPQGGEATSGGPARRASPEPPSQRR